MKNLILTLMMMLFIVNVVIAQSANPLKAFKKYQASVEYANYQDNLQKNLMKQAKLVKKDKKEKAKSDKKNDNFQARLARIKDE